MARYSEQPGDVNESIAAMRRIKAEQAEMDAKEKRYQENQERSGGLAERNAAARRDVARATGDLNVSLRSTPELLSADTEAWRANTIVLRENLGLRREIVSQGGTIAPIAAPTAAPVPVAGTRGAARAPAAPAVLATGDIESARAAERAAIARAEQARLDVAEARRVKAPPEDIAALTQTRGEATAAAQAARRNVTALEREAAASEAAAIAAREKTRADEAAARSAVRRAEADELAARASRVEAAGQAVSGRAPLQLGPGRSIIAGSAAGPVAGYNEFGGIGGGGGGRPPAPPGGPAGGGGGGWDEYRRRLNETAASTETAAMGERALQRDVQAAGSAYAASSNALSRHGALTTEFIQALARGDVTLREFSSQMVSTIGKFGGWLVAGAAIFGVIKMFEDLKAGALDTQEVLVNLGRFIPGLGGPAGGGKGMTDQAGNMLRDISTQFNVPIAEVGDSMLLVSRVFHSLGSAGEATRAVLTATRLDQIAPAQSTQYLLGIGQSLGWTSGNAGQQMQGARRLTGVIDSLNELQSKYGARVSQTLPAVARAAPAALAGGVDIHTLEALAGVGIRGGLPSGVVATSLSRALSSYIFRPQTQALFAGYGIQPSGVSANQQIQDVLHLITRRAEQGRPLGQPELRAFARSIATPQLAARTILPYLEAQQARPGLFENVLRDVRNPRSTQEDLGAVLSSVSERFKAIGNGLQNFGSQLASIGALEPIQGAFDTIGFTARLFQQVATPLERVIGLFNKLPGPLEQIIGIAGAVALGRRLYQRTIVGDIAGDFAGRLAGRDEFERSPRQVIRQRLAEARNVLLPEDQAEEMRTRQAAYRAQQRYLDIQREVSGYERRGVGRQGEAVDPASVEGVQYERRYAQATKAEDARTEAERAAANASQQRYRREADISLMKDKNLTVAEKTTLMDERGLIASEETTNLRQQANKALADQIAALRATAAGEEATGAATVGAAAAGVGAAALGGGLAAARAGRGEPGAARVIPFGRGGSISYEPGAIRSRMGQFTDFMRQNEAMIPFAGLIGNQLLSSAVGGGVGQFLQNVGDPALMGGMVSQMLNRGIGPGLGAGLVLGGVQQGGPAGAISSGVGGFLAARPAVSLAAKAISALTPLDVVAPEIGLPAQLAIGAASALLPSVLGGGASPEEKATAAQRRAQQQIASYQAGTSSLKDFQEQFGQQLALAIAGTGDAAQKGQDYVNKGIQSLVAQIQLFGASSAQGKTAQAALRVATAGAAEAAVADPASAAQQAQSIIQGVTQSGQAIVQATTAQLKYASPADARRLTRQALTELDAGSGVRADEQELRATMANRARRIEQLRRSVAGPTATPAAIISGGVPTGQITGASAAQAAASTQATRDIATLERVQAADKAKLASFVNISKGIDAIVNEQKAAVQIAGLQAQQAPEATAVARQQATIGDPARQQWLSVWEDRRSLQAVRRSGLTGRARDEAIQQGMTKLQSDQQQYGQTIVGEMQAAGQVREAAIPSTDPVGRATEALRTASSTYNWLKGFMQRHREANNPMLLAQQLAAVEGAQQGVADAAYQQQQELAGSVEQLAVARAHGDPRLIAAANLVKGRTDLAQARTQAQKNTAAAEIIAAEDAGVDATRQWADAQAQLSEARTHGDAGLNAAIELRAGQTDFHLAKNRNERAAALTRIANAQTAAREAARATADAQTQIATAGDFGNSVAQANDAIAGANNQLRLAQTGGERLAAQAGLLNAVNQRQQAIADRFNEFAALAASETIDPVEAARRIAEGAQRALGATRGIDNIAKARANRNQTLQAYRAAKIDTRESDINFEFQMSEITTGSAVARLQDLLKLQGLTKAKRQQILEEIRRYQTGQESPIGAQGFDLAPGNIRLPTFYDVAHAVQRGRLQGPMHNTTANVDARAATTVNVYVNKTADIGQVADAIDRTTSSHLRQRLKAAGVR